MTSSLNLKYLTYTVFIINKFCSYQVEDTRHHSPEELRCDDSILSEYNLRSEEHTSELQSLTNLVCRLLLEKKNNTTPPPPPPFHS